MYNNPHAHKHAIPPIKKDILDKISRPLFDIMLLPVMQAAKWKEFVAAIDILSKNINKYLEYLQEQATKMQQIYPSLTLIRSLGDGTSSNVKFVVGASNRKSNKIA